jgi:hypothetical protein
MRKVVLLLGLFAVLAAAEKVGVNMVSETRQDGLVVTHAVVFTGTEYITLNTPGAAPPALPSDTGELWVDRNHRFGIVQGVAVQGDGMGVFAHWYLNAERVGYYRTLGQGIPAWENAGPFNGTYDGHSLGAGAHGEALAAATPSETREWSKLGAVPRWTYPNPIPAFTIAKTNATGTRVVAATLGTVYLFDAQSGDTLWSQPFSVSNGLQGLSLSTDGSVVAVTVYDSCYIFEDGTRRGAIPIGAHTQGTQYAAKLSGDGKYLVTGDYFGRVRLYRWSGTSYDMMWSAAVGNPWITDVGISRDGSTVAAGTGYANGKGVVFDSSSSTPLWSFQGFGAVGAEVASCALSDDGSRIAFASWGDTAQSGATYVLTVHDRSSSTPLCGVQRDEEVGSLFACDISADGQYVAAGGKAVHAYRMGNGGEVYAFLIGSTPRRNVGLAGITTPGRYMQVGSAVTPVSQVFNYGDITETFNAKLLVTGPRGPMAPQSVLVTDLAPGSGADATFSSVLPDTYGFYDFTFWTELDSDAYGGDDTLAVNAKCFHDAAARAVIAPFAEMTVGYPFSPVVKVFNTGSYTDDIQIDLTIVDSLGNPLFTDGQTASGINAGDSATATLASWQVPFPGRFTAVATAAATVDDFIPGNDTLRKPFLGTWEIIYDDAVPEAYYWVGPVNDSKFYVRFTPTATPPFNITQGRIWVNMANTPFEYVAVCKDAGGRPDTASILDSVANVSTPGAPGWITFDLDISRIDGSDLWMVARWPDGSPAMGVGADASAPRDLRSYFSSVNDTFRLWITHDWMMRLTQVPGVSGIAHDAGIAPPRFALGVSANPFRSATTLSYSLATKSRVALRVFDRSGREVRALLNAEQPAGSYSLRWDGKDNSGGLVPAGVYFCRMNAEANGFAQSRKLLLVR